MFENVSLNPSQFHGLTGELLDFASELGSIPGNLVHHLAFFGAALGRNPHVWWRSEIYPNLSVMLVGESACGKGESLSIIERIYRFPDPADADLPAPQLRGTISGDKFVATVSNSLATEEDGENRLLNIDEECNARFKAAAAWNSVHDEQYCKAFDGVPISGRCGARYISLANLHFGAIGHVTPMALERSMKRESFFNGFVNRSIWMGIATQDFRGADGYVDETGLTDLQRTLAESLRSGGDRDESIKMAEAAKKRFTDYICAHRAAMQGDEKLAASTQRMHLLCLKTALILSLCNRAEQIEVQSMDEAITVMECYVKTVIELFGSNARAEAPATTLCKYLATHGATSRTDLIQALSGMYSRSSLDELLKKLTDAGKITCDRRKAARGRFPHFYELAPSH